MNEVTVFSFQNQHEIRTVVRDGEPWFVAKDICDILELENVTRALDTLDNDEKSSINPNITNSNVGNPILDESNFDRYTTFPEMRRGGRPMSLVNESGLYALVFKSRKPEAQAFRKWVTSEVLPAIRKTGQYTHPTAPSLPLVGERLNIERFKVWHEFAELCGLKDNAALISADNTMRREYNVSMLKTAQIELKNPDQQLFLTPTQIAGRLKLSGPREVNLLLALKGFQTRENKQWLPTAKGQAFAVLLDTGKRHSSGVMIQQVKWKESILNELDIEEQ